MANVSIVVSTSTARDITVAPTRAFFRRGSGIKKLTWVPAGPTKITKIEFEEGAPISGLVGNNGIWTGNWDPDGGTKEVWKYSIELDIEGQPQTILDPEIENGPPEDEW